MLCFTLPTDHRSFCITGSILNAFRIEYVPQIAFQAQEPLDHQVNIAAGRGWTCHKYKSRRFGRLSGLLLPVSMLLACGWPRASEGLTALSISTTSDALFFLRWSVSVSSSLAAAYMSSALLCSASNTCNRESKIRPTLPAERFYSRIARHGQLLIHIEAQGNAHL